MILFAMNKTDCKSSKNSKSPALTLRYLHSARFLRGAATGADGIPFLPGMSEFIMSHDD